MKTGGSCGIVAEIIQLMKQKKRLLKSGKDTRRLHDENCRPAIKKSQKGFSEKALRFFENCRKVFPGRMETLHFSLFTLHLKKL